MEVGAGRGSQVSVKTVTNARYCCATDLDGDGYVTSEDFRVAKEYICKLNGWPADGEREETADAVFKSIWESLEKLGDRDNDGRITSDEWLQMWENLYRRMFDKLPNGTMPSIEDLPLWCYRYMLHRFHMFDRTGDGTIDKEEYEYVISHFNVSAATAHKAFVLFSENHQRTIDFPTFCHLCAEYYFSSDPAALGNFIVGKLDW
uniref:EF-hand domain-containing protein n=1 Tax=Plectus sambesii TaxID=2011161 RepID=A0A914WCC7_9BILA